MISVKDIPTYEVLEYQNRFTKNNAKAFPDGIGGKWNPSLAENMPFVYEALPYPEKVVFRKLQKLIEEDYLEYGVSERTAWLTDKGEKYLEDNKSTPTKRKVISDRTSPKPL